MKNYKQLHNDYVYLVHVQKISIWKYFISRDRHQSIGAKVVHDILNCMA